MRVSVIVLSLFSFVLGCNTNSPNEAVRTKTNINQAWLYSENPTKNLETIKASKKWSTINLPHTWNSEDPTDNDPGYRRSASWYKKEIFLSKIEMDRDYFIYFEGANISTEVYIGNEKVGEHIGGYIGFKINISNYLKKGPNTIYVRVDNSYDKNIIPSQKSDFFIYGGITRDVWLTTRPKTAIANVKLNTSKVSHKSADVFVHYELDNLEEISNYSLKVALLDPNGKVVDTQVQKVTNKSGNILLSDITNPKLWDVDEPNLYEVKIELLKGESLLDKISERVGLRWFEFKKNGPFYLNGRRLLLRGTHRHEEHAGVGAAMGNEQHRKDMQMIKEMGANFVRLAHYPQDPEVYKACDELGLLVWDELPWCRGGLGEEIWQQHTKGMLKEIIEQNYNHPSIIIWSLGNEMYWLPDFENGDDTQKMNVFLEELNTLAHELDSTRKTAIRKYYEGAEIVDVFSPSIWSGWYSGSYKNYEKAIDTYKSQYDHFLHAEYGGSSHVGRHSENPITGEGIIQSEGWEEAIVQTRVSNIAKIGDWSENYIVDLFDWHLHISEQDTLFVGNAQWAFKDFGTPLRPENDIPYVNQKGLVDRNGKPKDAYYVFKSYWSKEPFVYIESKTWTERQGPEGQPRSIHVLSNCNAVDLMLNGQDLGVRTRDIAKFPASGLVWDINFEEGNNELIAIAETPNGEVRDTLEVKYRHTKNGTAKALALSSSKLKNDRFLITATAMDSAGLRCLDYEDKVYFQCLGGGKTLKNQGTPTGSEVIAMANGQASIEIIPDDTDIPITVMVLNQNFKGTYLTIPKD